MELRCRGHLKRICLSPFVLCSVRSTCQRVRIFPASHESCQLSLVSLTFWFATGYDAKSYLYCKRPTRAFHGPARLLCAALHFAVRFLSSPLPIGLRLPGWVRLCTLYIMMLRLTNAEFLSLSFHTPLALLYLFSVPLRFPRACGFQRSTISLRISSTYSTLLPVIFSPAMFVLYCLTLITRSYFPFMY
jgi:hypothetical protein